MPEDKQAPSAHPANDKSAPASNGGQLPAQVVTALGSAVLLMMGQAAYRHLFLTDLEWMALPPILLNQFRLFNVGGRVVAFAAWASLSEGVEARLNVPNPRLAPAEWNSGDRLWLIHLVAPFGHGELALKELRETVFAGKSVKMLRPQREAAMGKPAVPTPEQAASSQGLAASVGPNGATSLANDAMPQSNGAAPAGGVVDADANGAASPEQRRRWSWGRKEAAPDGVQK